MKNTEKKYITINVNCLNSYWIEELGCELFIFNSHSKKKKKHKANTKTQNRTKKKVSSFIKWWLSGHSWDHCIHGNRIHSGPCELLGLFRHYFYTTVNSLFHPSISDRYVLFWLALLHLLQIEINHRIIHSVLFLFIFTNVSQNSTRNGEMETKPRTRWRAKINLVKEDPYQNNGMTVT